MQQEKQMQSSHFLAFKRSRDLGDTNTKPLDILKRQIQDKHAKSSPIINSRSWTYQGGP